MGDAVTTLVMGLGRCGLSLVMQMLEKGGAPVFGTFPAYEDASPFDPQAWPEALTSNPGKVFKIVDPQHWEIPPVSALHWSSSA